MCTMEEPELHPSNHWKSERDTQIRWASLKRDTRIADRSDYRQAIVAKYEEDKLAECQMMRYVSTEQRYMQGRNLRLVE